MKAQNISCIWCGIMIGICIALMIVLTVEGNCQDRDTTKPKDQYKKVVTVDLQDLQVLLNGLARWRDLEMYNPNSNDKQKVQTYKDLDDFSKRLMAKLKVDSVLVPIDTTRQKKK